MNIFVNNNNDRAFTIVELLVVIVVIGILASITIVSYAGITRRANIASLESDLSNDSKVLKMYYAEHGSYPTSLGADNCPTLPVVSSNYCIKTSPGTTLTYTGGGNAFKILVTKNGISYYVTEGSAISAVSAPVVNANTVSAITGSAATIGGTIASNGGADVTAYGVCYGLTANPTNCTEIEQGALTAMAPASIATTRPQSKIVTSSDGKNVYSVSDTGDIRMYSRDMSTNALTILSPATITSGNSSGEDLILSPDGKFVYAVARASSSSDDIYMYSRDESTGLLTALSPNKQFIWTGSGGTADTEISNDGKHIYVCLDNKIYIYSRNLVTGLLTLVNSFGVTIGREIALSPDGLYLHVANVDASNEGRIVSYSRNISTGALTYSSAFLLGNNVLPNNLVISSDGMSLYVGIPASSIIRQFSRNTSNGQLTALTPNSIFAGSTSGLELSVDNRTLYASEGGVRIRMYSRNMTNGLLTALSTPFLVSSSDDIYVTPDNKSIYSANTTSSVNMYNRSYGAAEGAVFTKSITGLTAGTTYYYRSFSTNSAGTSYSADSTFVTL